jgi:hypothetical protein
LQVGTGANNLVQLNGSGQLPAVSAANLVSFPTFNQNTTGTAANLSGTPTLPNGTAATTQTSTDNTTKLATDAFVLAANVATASNLSGTPALPNGTTGTTQTIGDNTTKLATDAFVLANVGAGGVTSCTTDGAAYYTGALLVSCVAAPTTNGVYSYNYNITAGVAAPPVIGQLGMTSNAITGATTSFTVLYSHVGQIIEHDKSASGTVNPITLPTATTLGDPGFVFFYSNHSAQTDVLTPTTWTIQAGTTAAASTLSIPPGTFCRITVDSNSSTNWIADCATATIGTTTIGTTTVSLPSGSAITSGQTPCPVVTATVTGALTTDGLITNFVGDFTTITGYGGVGTVLSLYPWISATNTVSVKVCNWTASSITPSAATLGVKVVR